MRFSALFCALLALPLLPQASHAANFELTIVHANDTHSAAAECVSLACTIVSSKLAAWDACGRSGSARRAQKRAEKRMEVDRRMQDAATFYRLAAMKRRSTE